MKYKIKGSWQYGSEMFINDTVVSWGLLSKFPFLGHEDYRRKGTRVNKKRADYEWPG